MRLLLLLLALLPIEIQAVDLNFYRSLAAHHAPIVLQNTGRTPKADAITRFDFDGDFVANNNWSNLDRNGTPAFVYYEVIESETHWFLTYAFFHPRDYWTICFWKMCHENDLEGIILTIEKDGSEYGRFFQLETMAHNRIYTSRDPVRLDPKYLFPSGDDRRVVVDSEWGGHGVTPWEGKWKDKVLIYTFEGRAQDPLGTARGRFGYDLVPLNSLWALKDLVGRGQVYHENFIHEGVRFSAGTIPASFAGEKYGKGMANPPWAWQDTSDKSINRGDWFLDPAYSAFRHDPNIRTMGAPSYLYNPYLEASRP